MGDESCEIGVATTNASVGMARPRNCVASVVFRSLWGEDHSAFRSLSPEADDEFWKGEDDSAIRFLPPKLEPRTNDPFSILIRALPDDGNQRLVSAIKIHKCDEESR